MVTLYGIGEMDLENLGRQWGRDLAAMVSGGSMRRSLWNAGKGGACFVPSL